MITYTTGNLFEAKTEALVNTVNCVGIMGKGIALQFKQAYPNNYGQYVRACKAGDVQPGRMFITSTGSLLPPCRRKSVTDTGQGHAAASL